MADFGDNVSTNGGFLDELLAGLNEAVISAQRIAEKQHIDMVDLYFDDDTGEPITMDLKIPSTHPQKEFEELKKHSPKVEKLVTKRIERFKNDYL